ncbi:Nuclear import protein mog1 [Neolecta irregularis DAH-3]|uniref:Nuclear import protein mog1 n=1 Tax=Neolecta irregularis (strain DAH-3) TaxID=1198029 RepID=A0A1U7LJL8_NEOID|nr:Nuclear import protein mog1 [Neolecta irregularis DAH-3]|eukprot:OLL22828.1 Nuclear import protein mog1 [Neolecta irregularis DAH-3]
MMDVSGIKSVDLFGGAIVTKIPSSFIDGSVFRQTPDNQEVYVDLKEGSDLSLIIEILEREACSDEESAIVHFNAIAYDNDVPEGSMRVLSNELVSTETVPNLNSHVVYLLSGIQEAYKWGRKTVLPPGQTSIVVVIVAVIRLTAQATDLVISLNVPVILQTSSLTTIMKDSEIVCIALKKVEEVLKALTIQDYSLFS